MLRRWAPALAIVLTGFALRVYHLDYRALWWDEGLSLLFARLSFRDNAAMAVRLADTNPPVYRMLLGGWTSLAGSSVFSARLFSALAGVITVAATLAIGWRLLGRAGGGWAALFSAASPMLVYYSQEAKAYSLVAASGLLSILFWAGLCNSLVRASMFGRGTSLDKSGGRSAPKARFVWLWLGYCLSLVVAVGSHYIAAFLVAVQGWWSLAASVPCLRRSGEKRRAWQLWLALGGAWLVAAMAGLPFLVLTYGQTSAALRGETGAFEGLSGPVRFFAQHALEFAAGPGKGGAAEWAAAFMLVALILFGGMFRSLPLRPLRLGGSYRSVISPRRREESQVTPGNSSRTSRLGGSVLVRPWSWLLIPLLAGYALNSYHQFFFPRFLLYCVPAFLLLGARGLSRLPWRPWDMALVAFAILGLWIPSLARHYAEAGEPGEDWRPLARAVGPYMRADDAAIYGWGWMPGYLHAYLPPAPEPEYYLGFYTPETLNPELSAVAAIHDRVWLMGYRIDALDRYNAVGRWLAERSALVYSEWFGHSQIALFAMPPPGAAQAGGGPPRAASFDGGITLRYRTLAASLSPGDALVVDLEWRAASSAAIPYTVFLHVIATDGSLAAGRDTEPANGLRPTDAWPVGELVSDRRGLLLPSDLPPGRYAVRVGLYDPVTGLRVNAAGEDSVMIGSLEVQ